MLKISKLPHYFFMKTKTLFSVCVVLFTLSAIAQNPTANLTIFSEDGSKFFLFLNGVPQGTIAQTNLRVEGLPQAYYNAKIVFENSATPEILKNYLGLTDANGVMQDVVYKLKREKNNGKMSLKYFSMVPVKENLTPPKNVVVTHYYEEEIIEEPPPIKDESKGTTTKQASGKTVMNVNVDGLNIGTNINDPAYGGNTQTTTTTTTSAVATNSAVNVNVGGLNMSVNINDPAYGGNTQTTTTTTTTTTSAVAANSTNTTPKVVCLDMMPADFSAALSILKKQGFDDVKLSTAKQIATGNCLNTTQIIAICNEFGFEDSKLAFAKFAYDHCSEKKNYFRINNVFSFSSSSDELNSYIEKK